jgi:MutS domain V
VDGRRDRSAVAAQYASRRARLGEAIADLERADRRLAAVRLGLAALVLAIVVGAIATARWPWLVAALPAAGFIAVAVAHARRLEWLTLERRRLAYVEHGLARLADRWHGLGRTHTTFLPTAHVYAEDLDLFGRGSLFDLLCTARTEAGERMLADWLLAAAPPDVVAARQAAVRDMAERAPLREDLATLGPELPDVAATAALGGWASGASRPPALWMRGALVAMSAVTLSGLVSWWWNGLPPVWLGGALAAQAVVGWWRRPDVRRSIQHVDQRARELALAATLIARVTREPFVSPALVEIQRRLSTDGTPAAEAIGRLARLTELLASRQNQFFGPLAALLFWATHLSWAIDAWRARFGRRVPGWFAALGELEAIAALATFAAERPDAVYPDLQPGPPYLSATGLRHPLLPADTAVGNDVELGGEGPHLLLVSGSNMSGKSTYLRAIGVNVVLAQAGAPVTAATMTLTPLTPAGTLRVQDSLEAGASRFFAEITKLRAIVDLAKGHGATGALFLLDELLAGTNSHDRQHGADRLLRGLVRLGAIGLATTHDLALTDLAAAPDLRAVNVHFADRFDDGQLTFDFRRRPGVVGTSNALALMRAIGLEV